ncbi:MAG TPA: Xaa-Pro peptidase family protein [Candidatus Limnocylindria bacterium]|nr:Xaa-Pro peptidase family protein [Candidatus Limnocylindria bacterium]
MPVTGYTERRARAADACRAHGVAAILAGPGSDLTYLTGYRIHTSERLTCLVLPAEGEPRLVVPGLEAPRARLAAPDLALCEWQETDDPHALAASLVTGDGAVAVGDQLWSAFLLRLQERLPGRRFRPASDLLRGLRMRKDPQEIAALRAVAEGADRAYARALSLDFEGRRERDVAEALAALLRSEGHDEVAFTIVASGANGASPHHSTGDRVLARGDTVVMDFGGTMDAYCSDITRTVRVGAAEDEAQRVHDVVLRAQEAGYAAARAGARAEEVDVAARYVIDVAGYGAFFIHRLGHGIGLDGHEHPYLVSGNGERLEPGMAFSIEPGIYLPGRFGVRIEDIAFIAPDGRAEPLNRADRAFATVA